jgi:phosphate starvation-inducible PhoH-like protein
LSDIILNVAGVDHLDLYGEKNIKLNLLKKAYPDVQITSRGDQIRIKGEKKDTQTVKSKFELMIRILKEKKELPIGAVEDLLSGINPFSNHVDQNGSNNIIVYGRDGKAIKPKTKNQKWLVEASNRNDIVFAIGPAGTGKTYTAVALAVRALKARIVKKIILTRPAVEAGENLGFLPGDLKDKVDPYLRPLYDALDDMFPLEKLNYFMTNRVIEVAPLAFMRGRTLDNSFIILDEAQNATSTQLKMFLTRIGPSAKAIITGDLSQIDLPRSQRSGLQKALDILTDVEGIQKVVLDANDVVRHRLVREIIKAYDADDAFQEEKWKKAKEEKNKAKSEEE